MPKITSVGPSNADDPDMTPLVVDFMQELYGALARLRSAMSAEDYATMLDDLAKGAHADMDDDATDEEESSDLGTNSSPSSAKHAKNASGTKTESPQPARKTGSR